MARYLNEIDVYNLLGERGMATVHCSQIDVLPRADVAPRAEVAREIFEEIEKIIKSPRTVGFCMTAPSFRQAISDYNEGIRKEILYYIAELKKKYTEPEPPRGD